MAKKLLSYLSLIKKQTSKETYKRNTTQGDILRTRRNEHRIIRSYNQVLNIAELYLKTLLEDVLLILPTA